MSLVVTCDGCGKVEKPRREDICDIQYRIDDETWNKDFCAKCQDEMKAALLAVLKPQE